MMYRRTGQNRVPVAVWVYLYTHVYQIEMAIQISKIMMDIYMLSRFVIQIKLELQLASSCTQDQDDAHAVAHVRKHRWR